MQGADRELETAAQQRFRISGPRFSIHVESDCAETSGRLERYLLPWLPRVSGHAFDRDVRVVVSRTARPGYIRVEWNGRTIAASERYPYVFTLIQQAADEETLRRLADEAVLHSGVVAHRGRAIILPGSSGSGKSSLVRELLRQGAEYCSDEFAIVDPRGWVHPYPRAMFLRDESGEQYPALAADLGAAVRTEPVPAALILFLRYESGGGFEIAPLDQSETLMRMLQNTPDILTEKPHVFEPLKTTASRAKAFAGIRGEGREAAARIFALLGELP